MGEVLAGAGVELEGFIPTLSLMYLSAHQSGTQLLLSQPGTGDLQ